MTILPDVERLVGELERFRLALIEIAVKIEEADRSARERLQAMAETARIHGRNALDTWYLTAEEARYIRQATHEDDRG